METIATLNELLAMADGPKLPVGTSDAKTPKISIVIKVSIDNSHENSRKYQDECFLDPRGDPHF